MSDNPCLVKIRGLIDYPNITEVNLRTGPSTTTAIAFKGAVGLENLRVLDVQPDSAGNAENGKIYQWFNVDFNDGRRGWVRDDLVEIRGECGQFGYGTLTSNTYAFDLTRGEATPPQTPSPATVPSTSTVASTAETSTPEAPAPAPTTPQPAPILNGLERVKKASFAITSTFEGTGYAAYNNYDAGIISYGIIQFTMAAGSLITVMEKYLARSKTSTATQLSGYLERMRGRDESLRQDKTLKNLLIAAANEPEMQLSQDEVATLNYWDKVVDGYITPRGLKTPLAYALLFDMGVNFGTGHGFVRLAEERLGVPSRSRPGENGITEQQLIAMVAELRRDSHYRQAERDNLPGLKVRGDFWMNLVSQGDWDLMGDSEGVVTINGHKISIHDLA